MHDPPPELRLSPETVDAFIVAACAPRDSGHGSGTLERAEALLAASPAIATANIHAAAVLGDDTAVRRFVQIDKANATAKGGPHGWDPLTHLCFSRYLRLDPTRIRGFVRAATLLLDAGANPNTGWSEPNHQPNPEWESVIYGAAGVARNPDLTRVLLERGADPNDGETPYHVPETHDNATMMVLVESGKLNQQSLATLLLRKADWHDYDGMKYLLDHGANPNHLTHWGYTALHQALRRDNDLAHIKILLDHGADAELPDRQDGRTAISIATRRGRRDVLELLEHRGIGMKLAGVERLIGACARNDSSEVKSIATREPKLVGELLSEGGKLLAEFSGVGNTEGVGHLLDLGVSPGALFEEGDEYWDVAPGSTALHVAAWRANHSTVKLMVQRGAPLEAKDSKGRTALMLAIKACVDSYWMRRRSPESVRILLDAGASRAGVSVPTGYDEVDRLLEG